MLENINWEGNSKAMFEKLVSSAPPFMRDKAQNDFKAWVEKKGITTLTEDLIEAHIMESAPAPIQGMVLAQIRPLRSK